MKNKSGFVTKRYTQPDYYENVGGIYEAIYILDDNINYRIIGECDPYDLYRENFIYLTIAKETKGKYSYVLDKHADTIKYNLKQAIEYITNRISIYNKTELEKNNITEIMQRLIDIGWSIKHGKIYDKDNTLIINENTQQEALSKLEILMR